MSFYELFEQLAIINENIFLRLEKDKYSYTRMFNYVACTINFGIYFTRISSTFSYLTLQTQRGRHEKN